MVFSKGKGISKADIAENGATPCIRYGELYTGYGERITKVLSATDIELSDLYLSRSNDVLIPASGEDRFDMARACCVEEDGVALGGDINVLRGMPNGVFLAYYLNNAKRREIASYAQGNSVVHLYATHLRDIPLPLPSLPEQAKIASFLSAVDRRIALLERRRDLLAQYKRGLMQKLFSQELRFRDAQGRPFPDWQVKRLGEVARVGSGRDYKHLGKGDIPVYGTGGLMTYADDFLYNGESVCIGRKGTIDKPVLLTGKFWTVDTLFYTHSFTNALPRFIYAVFQQINWQMHRRYYT